MIVSAPLTDVILTVSSQGRSDIRRIITGVIFDLDGVLTDTETHFFRAVNVLLTDRGHEALTDHEMIGLVGLDNASLWNRLRTVRRLGMSLAEYTKRVDSIAHDIYALEMKPSDGAIELLARVRAQRLPMGLATSGEMAWVGNRLSILGIEEAFDAVVTGDQTSHPKPDPEIYRTAMSELNIDQSQALAIEDSPIGIQAAKAAGMFTIAVRTTWTRNRDLSISDTVVDSLHEITFESSPVRAG